jgi:predicted RNase H-like HicB family nuclease
VTEGETYEDALAMAEEAIAGHLEALRKLGKPIPVEGEPRGPVVSSS